MFFFLLFHNLLLPRRFQKTFYYRIPQTSFFPSSSTLCPSAFLSTPFVILNQVAQRVKYNTFLRHSKESFWKKHVSVSMKQRAGNPRKVLISLSKWKLCGKFIDQEKYFPPSCPLKPRRFRSNYKFQLHSRR